MFSLNGEHIFDDGAVGVLGGRRFDGDLPEKSVHLQNAGVNIVHLAARPGTSADRTAARGGKTSYRRYEVDIKMGLRPSLVVKKLHYIVRTRCYEQKSHARRAK